MYLGRSSCCTIMSLSANAMYRRRKKPIGVVNTGILVCLTFASNAIYGLRYTSPNVIRRDHVWYQGRRDFQRQTPYATTPSTVLGVDHVQRITVSAASSSRNDDSFDSKYAIHDDGVSATNVPWVKYEMAPLPDSLIDTTLFVGNLGDFVTEDTLSRLFAQVSSLQTVPSAVARTPNNYSMGYAFVTFPTSEEMEEALTMFHGYSLEGRRIKVERIRSQGPRVRVPEQLLAYTLGKVKRVREGKPNTLRRISKDDVERLSRGQPAKKRGYGSRQVPHRLSEDDRAAFDRAARNGFVTLTTGGGRYDTTRHHLFSPSPLRNIHRQWCDARAKPQIILYKSAGRNQLLDSVLIDLSPLRCIDDDQKELLAKFKADIFQAANICGMTLDTSNLISSSQHSRRDANGDNDEISIPSPSGTATRHEDDQQYSTTLDESMEFAVQISSSSWATEPIWRLPVISVGSFVGDRAKAKEMCKQLSLRWQVYDDIATAAGATSNTNCDNGSSKTKTEEKEYPCKSSISRIRKGGGGKTKVKGLSSHRERSRQDR